MSDPSPNSSRHQMTSLPSWFAKQSNSEWPELESWQGDESGNSITLNLNIPAQLSYFAGHFPEQAVLPGVVQIHWAGEIAKAVFGLQGFTALQGSKFNGMVLPDSKVELTLNFKPEKNSVNYAYTDHNTKYSVGTLLFQSVKEPAE